MEFIRNDDLRQMFQSRMGDGVTVVEVVKIDEETYDVCAIPKDPVEYITLSFKDVDLRGFASETDRRNPGEEAEGG